MSSPDVRSGTEQRDDIATLARGGSLNLVGAVVSAVLNTLVLILITRGLGKAEAGTFFIVTFLFQILVQAAVVGADTGVLRFIPRYRALGRQTDIPTVLRAATIPVVALSSVLALALFVFADPLAHRLVGDEQADNFVAATRVIALFVPLTTVYGIWLSATRGFGTMKVQVLVDRFGRNLLQCGAILVTQVVAPTMLLLTLAWAGPYVAAAAVAIWWLHRYVGRSVASVGHGARTPAREVAGELWRFSVWRGVSRIFSAVLQRIDVLLVGAMIGPAQAAIYTAASRFLIIGLMVAQAIQQVMAPKISQLLAAEADNRARVVYQTSTAWLMLLTWPLYLSFAVFASFLLQIFGPGYASGATAVAILCSIMLVATACGSVDSVLLMGGKSSWSLINTGLALATNIAADLYLIPRYGITGAAIGWALAIVVNNVVPLIQVRLFLGMHPFGVGSRLVAVLALCCFGAVPLLARGLWGTGAVTAVGATGVAAGLYLAALWRFRRPLDLDAFTSILRRRSGRARRATPPAPAAATVREKARTT